MLSRSARFAFIATACSHEDPCLATLSFLHRAIQGPASVLVAGKPDARVTWVWHSWVAFFLLCGAVMPTILQGR